MGSLGPTKEKTFGPYVAGPGPGTMQGLKNRIHNRKKTGDSEKTREGFL